MNQFVVAFAREIYLFNEYKNWMKKIYKNVTKVVFLCDYP